MYCDFETRNDGDFEQKGRERERERTLWSIFGECIIYLLLNFTLFPFISGISGPLRTRSEA